LKYPAAWEPSLRDGGKGGVGAYGKAPVGAAVAPLGLKVVVGTRFQGLTPPG